MWTSMAGGPLASILVLISSLDLGPDHAPDMDSVVGIDAGAGLYADIGVDADAEVNADLGIGRGIDIDIGGDGDGGLTWMFGGGCGIGRALASVPRWPPARILPQACLWGGA